MVDGVEHKTLITIGFLNEKVQDNLELFKNNFDIVIVNDGTFDQVIELLKEIL